VFAQIGQTRQKFYDASKASPIFEIAYVLVSLDHVPGIIVNANQSTM
jgi:hypothetical protein